MKTGILMLLLGLFLIFRTVADRSGQNLVDRVLSLGGSS